MPKNTSRCLYWYGLKPKNNQSKKGQNSSRETVTSSLEIGSYSYTSIYVNLLLNGRVSLYKVKIHSQYLYLRQLQMLI
jgi:hypothetical protein